MEGGPSNCGWFSFGRNLLGRVELLGKTVHLINEHWTLETRKKQAWTGRSTLQPAGRPALRFHAYGRPERT